jgi:type II secretory pathway component GspD/PulD (secretin)
MSRLSGCVALMASLIITTALAEQPSPAKTAAASAAAARAKASATKCESSAATASPAPAKPAEAPAAAPANALTRICGAWCKRTVHHLNHAPAVDVARAINELYQEEGVVKVVAEPVTNNLLICALPEVGEQACKLAEQLDKRPAMVTVDVAIVEVKRSGKGEAGAAKSSAPQTSISKGDIDTQLRELGKSGQINLLERPRLMTLDNQPAFVQVGQRVPRITGSASSASGRVNSVTLENVGLIVGLTPRVSDDDTVTMQIDVEKSHLGPTDEGAPISMPSSGEPVRAPSIVTITAQSTVSMRDGQTWMLAGATSQAESGQKEIVILLSPKVTRTP